MSGLFGSSSKTPTQHQQVQLPFSPAENTPHTADKTFHWYICYTDSAQQQRVNLLSERYLVNFHVLTRLLFYFQRLTAVRANRIRLWSLKELLIGLAYKTNRPFTERVTCLESWMWLGASLSGFFLNVIILSNVYFFYCVQMFCQCKNLNHAVKKTEWKYDKTRSVHDSVNLKKIMSEWFIDSDSWFVGLSY